MRWLEVEEGMEGEEEEEVRWMDGKRKRRVDEEWVSPEE